MSWADDIEDFDTPHIEETVDADGIRTIVEYTTNEEGKKIKITRRIKQTLTRSNVEPAVAARKSWAKFGADQGKPGGLDRATTTLGENVGLKLMPGGYKQEPEPDQESEIKLHLDGKKITCRLCKGLHFTAKCPYRDTLHALETDPPEDGTSTPRNQPGPGVYVPPVICGGGGRGMGELMSRPRDDLHTLRVTNLSEDAEESDLRDLFSRFGRVLRVRIGRDRDTGVGKGYAFVSYEDKASAEKAMARTNGMGYDNLILNVQWSQPREARP